MCSGIEREAVMIPASITNYLEQNHARYSVIPHRAAYTAQEEAAAAHVPGAAWAKSVVCMADDELFLAVVPASSTVDFDRLKRTVAEQTLIAAEHARRTLDFERTVDAYVELLAEAAGAA